MDSPKIRVYIGDCDAPLYAKTNIFINGIHQKDVKEITYVISVDNSPKIEIIDIHGEKREYDADNFKLEYTSVEDLKKLVKENSKPIQLGDMKITSEQRDIITDILDSTRITEGKWTKRFEEETAKFLGVKEVIAVSNGTVALELVARFMKNTFDNTVFHSRERPLACIPATTFPATINAFINAGYDIKLCDVNEKGCIDITTLTDEEKLEIDVMVPVHLLGYTCDMDHIMYESDKYGWFVIEDFAEAFGSTYNGKKVGTLGLFGCSSFYVSHVLQGGELGIVTTNNKHYAKIMRSMKNHGRVGPAMEFQHDYIGSNYKTTEFCTGLCYPQIRDADKIIKIRQQNAKKIYYGVENPNLTVGTISTDYSYLGFPIIAETKDYKKRIRTKLHEAGIETRGMFPCLARQKAYADMGFDANKYPVSTRLEDLGFYVGIHQYLTEKEIDKIITLLNGG